MLLYSLVVLVMSISLMWYAIRTTVVNPPLRPRLVATPRRMAVLNLSRLLTTALGVAGVWYSCGWLAGVCTLLATEFVRSLILRGYVAAAIRDSTAKLLQGHPGVDAEAAQQAAASSVQAWIRGKE